MRRVLVIALLVLGWFGAGVSVAAPALAHAVLDSTDPPDGTRLSAVPESVTLTFSEDVSLRVGYVHVVDGHGRRAEQGQPVHPGGRAAVVTVRLRSGLGQGSYLVSYGVVSADSHPVSGGFAFVVGNGPLINSAGAVTGSGGTDPIVNALFTLVRWASYLGLVLLGGAAFVGYCWPAGALHPRARRLVATGWLLCLASALAALLLQGPYAAGQDVGHLFSTNLLSATMSTTYGRVVVLRLIVLLALAVLLPRLPASLASRAEVAELRELTTAAEREAAAGEASRRLVVAQARTGSDDWSVIAGLVLLATFSAAGHAISGPEPTVAILAQTAHLAAMSVWVGGLVLLSACVLPSGSTTELAAALPRFSRLAFGSVVVLGVTGSYQAWRQVGSLPALAGTGYGRLLAVKVTLFVLLVGLGNLGRLSVRRHFAPAGEPPPTVPARDLAFQASAAAAIPSTMDVGGPVPATGSKPTGGLTGTGTGAGLTGVARSPGAVAAEPDLAGRSTRSRLRHSVGAEVALAVAVLAVTSVLVAQPPARASYQTPSRATVQLRGGATASVLLSPARAGRNELRIALADRRGVSPRPGELTGSLTLPAERIGPLRLRLAQTAPGRYRAADISLPRPGEWRLELTARLTEFDAVTGETTLIVR